MSMPEKQPIDVLALYPAVADIQDVKLRQGVIEIWEEMWEASAWQSIEDVPTSGEIAYPNLPHTQCIVEMAIAVADAFERHHKVKVDRDILIAAAVLQDASKVVEYRPDGKGGAQHTDIGRNYLHGFWCAHLIAKRELPHAVAHIALTHGSAAPRFPESIEGKILYYVDQLDVIAIHGDRWTKKLMITK